MVERLFIPAMFMSRDNLRDLNIRVYGEPVTLPPADYPQHPVFHQREILGHLIAPSAAEKLLEVGITATPIRIQSEDGATFTNPTIPNITDGDTARLAIVTYRTGALAVPGVPSPEFGASIGTSANGTMRDMYELQLRAKLSELLGPVVRRHITINVHSAEAVAVNQDPAKFTVHVWASPLVGTPSSHIALPEPCPALFGVPLPEDGLCRDPIEAQGWDEGISIRAPEGAVLGVFDANNLYTYLDLTLVQSATELELWAKIAEHVVANFARTAGPDHAELRAKYVELASRRNTMVIAKLKSDATSLQTNITETTTQLGQLLFKRDKTMRDIKHAEDDSVSDTAALAREYDNIVKMPFIKKVRFVGNTVVATTDVVFVTDPRSQKEHEIGTFKITLDLDRVMASMLNQVRRVKGYEDRDMHHPHVFPDGNPCLGSLQESLPNLLREFRMCDAIGLIWGYLCSVNVEDGAGKHVHKWPLSEAQKAKDAAATAAARRVAEAAVTPAPAI